MKDPSDKIRTWLYNVLNLTIQYSNAYVPVYSFPFKDAAMPYIVIDQQTMAPETGTKDCYITENEVIIEIYSSHTGNDASYKSVNSIAEDILEIVRQRAIETHGSGGTTVATITGYNPVSITLAGSVTNSFLFETNIVMYKALTIKLILEET